MAKKKNVIPTPKLKRQTRLVDQYRLSDKGDLVKYQIEIPVSFDWEDETEITEGNEDERGSGISN